MERRNVLKLGFGAAMGWAMDTPAASPLRVIDAHIHLFDTDRPGGVPWPEKTDAIYFVASGNGDGSHVFSATLEQHNAAVAQYLARQRQRSRSESAR